jgi:hypothetical protein
LTSNIRTKFLRFAPFDRAGESSSRERTPLLTSRHQSPQPREQTQDHNEYQNSRWHHNNPAAHGAGGFPFEGNHNPTQTPTTHLDPLAGILAQPINLSTINVSFMPPPASVYFNYYDPSATSPKMELDDPAVTPQAVNSTTTTTCAPGSNVLSDWIALPLDPFFNSSTAGVDQGLGGTGPMVGEFDMLEILLKEQYTGDACGGGGSGGANGAGLPSQIL